jgi:hypothetical protein
MTIEKFSRLILGLALTFLFTRSAHAQGAQPPAKSSPTLAELLPPALQSCNGATPSTADMDVERRSIYVPASDGV